MAAFSLTEVLSLIECDEIEFARSSAINPVIREYSDSNPFMTPEEAENFIIDGIRSLEAGNFVKTVPMVGTDSYADEYGLVYDNRGWYIKLSIETYPGSEERYVDNISFHPPRRDLSTVGGIKLKGRD